jgi:hypothetical protein
MYGNKVKWFEFWTILELLNWTYDLHNCARLGPKFYILHQGAIIQYFWPYPTGTPTTFAAYLIWYKLKSQDVLKTTSESCFLYLRIVLILVQKQKMYGQFCTNESLIMVFVQHTITVLKASTLWLECHRSFTVDLPRVLTVWPQLHTVVVQWFRFHIAKTLG